jgi:hypothetical protein
MKHARVSDSEVWGLPRSGDHLGTTRHARDQTTRMWLNAVPDSSIRLNTL